MIGVAGSAPGSLPVSSSNTSSAATDHYDGSARNSSSFVALPHLGPLGGIVDVVIIGVTSLDGLDLHEVVGVERPLIRVPIGGVEVGELLRPAFVGVVEVLEAPGRASSPATAAAGGSSAHGCSRPSWRTRWSMSGR